MMTFDLTKYFLRTQTGSLERFFLHIYKKFDAQMLFTVKSRKSCETFIKNVKNAIQIEI